jgi:hypothetical protein
MDLVSMSPEKTRMTARWIEKRPGGRREDVS